jgi:phospholipid transport system substrate-binding protein
MHTTRILRRITIIAFIVLGSAKLFANTATDFVNHVSIDANTVLAATTTKEDLQSKLKPVLLPLFDLPRMTRGAFGPVWRELSAEEQTQAISNFSVLVFNTYLSKATPGKQFSFEPKKELQLPQDRASVSGVFTYDKVNVAMEYRLIKSPTGWLITDVLVENVSLVSNYRSQFSGISSKKKLLETLRLKANELSSTQN